MQRSQVSLSSSPLPLLPPFPPSSSPPFTSASALLRSAPGVHGSARPTSSSSPDAAPGADDSGRLQDLSDDAADPRAAPLDADVDAASVAPSHASALSTASAASLSSLSSLLRSLRDMSAQDLQTAGILPSPATSFPSSSPLPAPPRTLVGDCGLREVGDEGVWTLSSCKPGNGVGQLRDGKVDTFWQSDGLTPHYVSIHFARKTKVSLLSFYVDYALDESYTPSRVIVRGGSHSHAMRELCTFDLVQPTGWVNVQTLVPVQREVRPRKMKQSEKGKMDKAGGGGGGAGKGGGAQTAQGEAVPVITPASFFSTSNPTSRLAFARPAAKEAAEEEGEGEVAEVSMQPLRCHYLQLVVLASHQSGKDTHVREMKVYGPGTTAKEAAGPRGRGEAENGPHPNRGLSHVALRRPVFSSIEFQSTSVLR